MNYIVKSCQRILIVVLLFGLLCLVCIALSGQLFLLVLLFCLVLVLLRGLVGLYGRFLFSHEVHLDYFAVFEVEEGEDAGVGFVADSLLEDCSTLPG